MSAKRIAIFNPDNPSGGNAVVGARFIGRLTVNNRPINRAPTKHERSNELSGFNQGRGKQHGAALIVMLVIVVMGAAIFLVSSLSSAALQIKRDEITAASLAQAKDALIGYAASVKISSSSSSNQPRPGDLPCPDTNNTGVAGTSCGSAAGSNQALRLGRLPWKTLGLPDLRDGSGERLWYAVSNNFKNSTRTSLLNSDTVGTISVFAPDGTRLNDGSGSTGAVAVIIAPGDVLTRTDKTTPQDRSSAGINNPQNYLDIALGEDNASFTDGSSTNGFIQGRIKDSNGNTIVNDQLLVISQDNIMQAIQKRVAGEVKNCLQDYASNNRNRYPWAAPITDLTTPYDDNSGTYFGRIPDNLNDSKNDIQLSTSDTWGAACNTHTSNTPATWWMNWKEMVFYGLAKKFKPNDFNAPSFPSTCATAGNCLSINNSSTPARFVVIVAGKMLSTPNQANRNSNNSTKSNAFYYLEGGNQNADQSGGYTFIQGAPLATFNDTVVFQ